MTNSLIHYYKLTEPALAGSFVGIIQTSCAQSSIQNNNARVAFVIGAALTVLTTTLPLTFKAKLAATAVAGLGAGLVYRFEWIQKNKMHLMTLATLASSAFELSQGQRAYPLAKMGGTLYVQLDAFLESKERNEKSFSKKIAQVVTLTLLVPFIIGCAVQGGIIAFKKFSELNRGPQIAVAAFTGLILLSAASARRQN